MKIFAALFLLATTAHATAPRLSNERLVLHTVAGDMVFALYPDVAPKHVAQILALARLGVYDGTHFFRLEPNFVIQLGNAQDRLVPMTPQQTAALMKIPLEVTPDLKHSAGVLSMAHWDEDVNSAETSFSILLNFAPHLDGKYTIFGHLERGVEVLLEMVKSPRESNHRPRTRLAVDRAEVVDSLLTLDKMTLAPLRPIVHAEVVTPPILLSAPLLWGLTLLVILSLCFAYFGNRVPVERAASLHLLSALVAAFLLVVGLLPFIPGSSWIGLSLFLLLVFLFRSLGRFESA